VNASHALETTEAVQLEQPSPPESISPPLCQQLVDGAPLEAAFCDPAGAARLLGDAERERMERRARTPLVPLAWIRGTTQVTPEEAGERKAGRPKINVRHTLSVTDLDNYILYMQRRTRELQKRVEGTHAHSDHTTKMVKATIRDAIRRLCVSLPEANRDAIDSVVAGI